MTAAVGLLYLAGMHLHGLWMWGAITLGVGLLLRRGDTHHDRRFSSVVGALLLFACAVLAQTVVFAVLGVLLLLRQGRLDTAVVLTLALIGAHLVWWRYLSAYQLLRMPTWIAAGTSWLLGTNAFIDHIGAIVHGQLVRFSVIPVVVCLAPMMVVALSGRVGWRSIARLLGAAFIALAATFAAAITFALVGHVHFFASPLWLFVCLAIGVAAARIIKQSPMTIRWSWTAWAAGSLALFLVWQFGFHPSDARLRIAFDEAHGKWETVDGPFDTERYGRDTVYNYVLLRRWLALRHHVTTLDMHWSTLETDVLVLKMPTEFYSADEKRAIDAFLQKGGLLLVIGDHTNLYGTAFVINDLLRPYGFEIEADATVPWDSPHYDFRPVWWQRTRYLRGVPLLQFQTAATLKAHNPRVLPVIVGDRVGGEDADYSNERFFGSLHPGPEDRQPPLVVAAERRVGRGRIVLFADSTIFSTFSLMAPGNRELFQNFLEQGTQGRSMLRLLLFGLFAGCVVVGGGRRLAMALALLPPLCALAGFQATRGTPVRYPGSWVEVDDSHSHMTLRADPRNEHGPDFDDYSTFFAWIARAGPMPTVVQRPFAQTTTPTIIGNPDKPFSQADMERAEHYLKAGGRILLLDDPRFAARSTAAPFLAHFGVMLRPVMSHEGAFDAGPPWLPENLLALPFTMLQPERRDKGTERARRFSAVDVPTGLNPTLVDDDGLVIAGQTPVGRGTLMVFLRSTAFSEVVMGDVWVGQEIAPERKALYDLEYRLVNLLGAQAIR